MLIIESFRNFANSTYNREGAYNRVTRVVVLSVSTLEVTRNKVLGLRKIFRYTFMTLLKLFYFRNFSLFQLKKQSAGKLRLS